MVVKAVVVKVIAVVKIEEKITIIFKKIPKEIGKKNTSKEIKKKKINKKNMITIKRNKEVD